MKNIKKVRIKQMIVIKKIVQFKESMKISINYKNKLIYNKKYIIMNRINLKKHTFFLIKSISKNKSKIILAMRNQKKMIFITKVTKQISK